MTCETIWIKQGILILEYIKHLEIFKNKGGKHLRMKEKILWNLYSKKGNSKNSVCSNISTVRETEGISNRILKTGARGKSFAGTSVTQEIK